VRSGSRRWLDDTGGFSEIGQCGAGIVAADPIELITSIGNVKIDELNRGGGAGFSIINAHDGAVFKAIDSAYLSGIGGSAGKAQSSEPVQERDIVPDRVVIALYHIIQVAAQVVVNSDLDCIVDILAGKRPAGL